MNPPVSIVPGRGVSLPLDAVTSSQPPAAARGGDHILLATGGAAPDDGFDHLRIWLAPAIPGAAADVLDFPSTGALDQPTIGWSGSGFVIVALRCPDPWIPTTEDIEEGNDSPGTPVGNCGSDLWDVYRLDPETQLLDTVALGLEEGEGSIRVFANGEAGVLLGRTDESGESGWLIADDGTVSRVPVLSAEEGGFDAGATLCPTEAGLLALGSPVDPLHPRGALLGDGTWEASSVPTLEETSDNTDVLGCLDGGVAILGSRDVEGLFDAVHLLTPDDSGELTWRRIPFSMPREPIQPVDATIVDGTLLASVSWRPGQVPAGVDSMDPVPMFRWDGTTWRPAGDTVGTPPRAGVILGEGEAVLTIERSRDDTFSVRISGL
jgi:hypothetical protein